MDKNVENKMSKCKVLRDNEFVISKLSETESVRNFIKFRHKQVPEQLKIILHQTNLEVFFEGGEKSKIMWGTGNRLYIPRKKLRFDKTKKYKIRFGLKGIFEILEIQ